MIGYDQLANQFIFKIPNLHYGQYLMGWWANRFGKMAPQVADLLRSVFIPRWSYSGRRNSAQYLELFHTTPRLDSVDIIATDCANTNFKIYKKSDLRLDKMSAEPIGDHPIYDLLENPIPSRPDIDGFTLRYMTNVYLELLGDVYWVVVKDVRGQPRELYVVPSTWVISTPTDTNPYYLVQPFGNTNSSAINIAAQDVIWWKNPDLTLPYGRGRGRTERIGDEIETDEYAKKYMKNFFYNDATPQGIITAPGANPEQIKVLTDSWSQSHRGIGNAKKTGFFGFDAKYIAMSTSPRELDFIESNKALRDACNQHYQIPPEIQGIIENSNRSTIDASFYLYAKNVILKRNLRFEAVITRQLLPMYDTTLALVCDNVVPEDREYDLKEATTLFQAGIINRGQALLQVGKPLFGNEFDDEFLIPFSMTAVSSKTKPQTAPVVEAPPVPEVPLIPNGPDTTNVTEIIPLKTFKGYSQEQRKQLWQQFDKAATKQEEPFRKGMKKIADLQQKEFDAEFTDAIGRGENFTKAVESAAKITFGDAANNAVKRALYQGWVNSMTAGYNRAKETADVKVDIKIVQPIFKDWIEQHGLEKATSINETSKDGLRKSLAEGVDAGETIRQLQGRIAEEFDGVRDYRTERIARTESAASMNMGTLSTYKAAGLQYKQWLAVQDDRTRQDHLDADGQIVAVDEPFNIGGEEVNYPGDPEASADESINCRCSILSANGPEASDEV